MKYGFVFFCCTFFTLSFCDAQTASKTSHNALSLEIGKTGLIYNLIFDHRFQNKKLGIRAGIGSNFGKYLTAFLAGGGGYYLLGKTNSSLELGVDIHYLNVDEVSDDQKGFTLVYPDYTVKTPYLSMNIGYRSYGRKSLVRIGVSPGVIKDEFILGGYISYGFVL